MNPVHIQLANSTLRRVIKRLHCSPEVMLVCVRWYAAYPLSLRNPEEMMAERGVVVDRATVHRWALIATEAGHLAAIETLLSRRQRSRLLPLWRRAGWLTGALPALVGPRAVRDSGSGPVISSVLAAALLMWCQISVLMKVGSMQLVERVKEWARALKRETVALWFASRDPRTPWTAKVLAVFTVGYALSPIDLIPDFIPVLGFVDDAILLPGLIWLTLRLLPRDVIADSRVRADEWLASGNAKPVNRVAVVFIVAIWLGATYWAWRLWST